MFIRVFVCLRREERKKAVSQLNDVYVNLFIYLVDFITIVIILFVNAILIKSVIVV